MIKRPELQSLPPKCEYAECTKHYTLSNTHSLLLYKSCHYCYTFYCSRKCRQLDWYAHKSSRCFYGRLSSFCKRILTKVGRQCVELRAEISKIAQNAYTRTCNTRGFVWLDFASALEAQQFVFKPLSACKLSNFLIYFGDHLLPKYVCVKSDNSILGQLFPEHDHVCEPIHC